jgi:DNA-binding NarL/FixJ family response regulator
MKWCLVDEREDQREEFARLLSNHGVDVDRVPPDPNLGFTHLAAKTATGFILDYALHEQDSAIPYSGATLAAHIRQEYPDRPIVILSAFLRDPATDERLRRTRELIDLKVKKDEVEQRPERFARQLQALAAGYERIRSILQEEDVSEAAARAILGLDQAITDSPALNEVVAYLAQVGNKDLALIARTLLHELLKFPGPLLVPEHAAVILGVDPQYGHDDALRRSLGPARYRGAFEDLRWDVERQIPLYWLSFLSDLKSSLPSFPPAVCFICRQEASTLCAECIRPVDGRHSLPAQRAEVTYPECRQARVCGNCLRKDELKSGVVLDPRHVVLRAEVVKESSKLLKKAQKYTTD